MTQLNQLPPTDSERRARENQAYLLMSRTAARALARETQDILQDGTYRAGEESVSIADALRNCVARTASLKPDDVLPEPPITAPAETLTVSVENTTSLAAAKRLADAGVEPLVLNFANAVEPGGGFLTGSTAQEEYLCRSSGLYAAIKSDPMYRFHQEMGADSFLASAWAILSPGVPVFRGDDGRLLPEPWQYAALTCAAPVARETGLRVATDAMRTRIDRVLSIARAYGYRSLVLGAWGCGAFHNDPVAIAGFFRDALTTTFLGAFDTIVFAITDWSPERRYLAPFADAFAAPQGALL